MFRHNHQSKRLQLGLAVLIPTLLVLTIWFTFFTVPSLDPQLSVANHGNHAVYHYNQFEVKDFNGNPAADAVVTIGDQQRVSDQNGRVYFDHLMHTWYETTIYHNGQHYKYLLPVSALTHTINLPFASLQFNRFMAVSTALALVALIVWAVSQNYQRTNRPLAFAFATIVLGIIAFTVIPLITSPVIAQASPTGTIIDTLPVPDKIKINEDDNNAVITWNGVLLKPDESEPEEVSGYRISWGVAGQPLANIQLTKFRIAQIQPLINGKEYEVQIQTVDHKGNLSQPSAPLKFTGKPDRVNALRSKMNGFFDDFNLPPGSGNELNWNNAYSACNEPELSTFFINTQYHAHNTVYSGKCDRAQSVSRARQIFDFTNRTGTITFDFDGSFDRDIWYLDLVPTLADITGHTHLETDSEQSTPLNTLRIRQQDDRLELIWIDGQGFAKSLASPDNSPYPTLAWLNLNLVPNVRRHWEIKVSTNQLEIFIEGKKVLSSKINLPFSKAHLLWTQFAYNSSKANQPYSMIHWDNFGFDAPNGFKPSTVTYNYPTGIPGGGDILEIEETASLTLRIPDQIKGNQTAERLIFTMQPEIYGYEWNDNDNVIINGKQLKIPRPAFDTVLVEKIINPYAPHTVVMDLPKGTLKRGDNNLEFNLEYNQILNIHAEIDYPVASAPLYTQPNLTKLNPATGIPITMPDVGPGAKITGFNHKDVFIAGSADENEKVKFTASSILTVNFEIDNWLALKAHGKNPGLARIEILIDKQVVFREEVAAPPSYKGSFKIDTTQFNNGVHALFIQAYNPYGTPSIPNYFESDSTQGDYYPVYVEFRNNNPSASFKPLPSISAIVPPSGNISATGNPPRPTKTSTSDAPAPTQEASANTNNPVSTSVPPNTAEIPAVREPEATFPNLSVTWIYILIAIGTSLYLGIGIILWGGVRKHLLAQRISTILPLISLDYMLIWPIYLITGKLPKSKKS